MGINERFFTGKSMNVSFITQKIKWQKKAMILRKCNTMAYFNLNFHNWQ